MHRHSQVMSTKQLTQAFSQISINESIQDSSSMSGTAATPTNAYGPEKSPENAEMVQTSTHKPRRTSYISDFFPDPLWYEKYLLESNMEDLLPDSQIRHSFDCNTEYSKMILSWVIRESKSEFDLYFKEQFPNFGLVPFDELMRQSQKNNGK